MPITISLENVSTSKMRIIQKSKRMREVKDKLNLGDDVVHVQLKNPRKQSIRICRILHRFKEPYVVNKQKRVSDAVFLSNLGNYKSHQYGYTNAAKSSERIRGTKRKHLGPTVNDLKFMRTFSTKRASHHIEVAAERVVDEVIRTAENMVNDFMKTERISGHSAGDMDVCSDSTFHTFSSHFLKFAWPTLEEFCFEKADTALARYLNIWETEEEWTWTTSLYRTYSDLNSDYYVFETIYSLPSEMYPIAQATASVFFTFKVSRILPPDTPVEVTFQYEGQRMEHNTMEYPLQEGRLFDILNAKLNVQELLTF